MKITIKKQIDITLVILIYSFFTANIAQALPVDFIDHNTYTTDTISNRDWLDVTISVNQSFNYVSTQFGSGDEYEGWRYANAEEFNGMISNYIGSPISTSPVRLVTHVHGAIDNLPFLLGNTLETFFNSFKDITLDTSVEGDSDYVYTHGLLSDSTYEDSHYSAIIFIDDISLETFHFTDHNDEDIDNDDASYRFGSYLVRDHISSVPIPSTIWFMATALLGLVKLSRRKSM